MIRSKIKLPWNKEVILLLLITILFVFLRYEVIPKTSQYDRDTSSFEGEIVRIDKMDSYVRIDLKGKEVLMGTYYGKLSDETSLEVGDFVLIEGRLEPIRDSTLPNLFSWARYYRSKNRFYYLTIHSIEKVGENPFSIQRIFSRWVSKEPCIKPYFFAFFLGDTSFIPDEVMDSYQINGISHLFAISGMHLSFLLQYTKKHPKLRVFFLILSFFLLHEKVSYLRAFFSFLISKLGKKRYSRKEVLTITVCFLLLINPYYLDQAGFWFSVVIGGGLMIRSRESSVTLSKWKKLVETSFLAFLLGMPISLYYFYKVNLLSFVWNLFFMPFFTLLFVPSLFLALFFPCFSFLTAFFIACFETCSFFCSQIDIFYITYGKPSILMLIFWCLFVLLVLHFLHHYLFFPLLTIGLLFLVFPVRFPSDEVVFLDVGQGDSTYFSSSSSTVLLDAGEKKGKEILSFLESCGVRKLDYLILSHGDQDHLGNALFLFEHIRIQNLIYNIGPINDKEEEVLSLAKKKKTSVSTCQEGSQFKAGNFHFFALTQGGNNENENSCIYYVAHDNSTFLFTGDMTKKEEDKVMKKYQLSDIDYLKIAHHGSSTSSSKKFIDYIHPKYSVISVGENNRYGHPKKSVLDRLANSKIYRTDKEGSIEVKFNKDGYKIRTCPP